MPTWRTGFEALSQDRKEQLVNQERLRFLRAYLEYGGRAHLPGWEQSFRSSGITDPQQKGDWTEQRT
jgi:hypothetical protein